MSTCHSIRDSGRQRRGMTIAEIVIVLSVAGAMIAIAVPSFVTWRRETVLAQAVQQVRFELVLAQTESIKRNQHVSFYRIGEDAYSVGDGPKRLLPFPVSFSGGPDSVRFAPFGPPTTGAAQFTLETENRSRRIDVSLGGHVSIR